MPTKTKKKTVKKKVAKKSDVKTKPRKISVTKFVNDIKDPQRKKESKEMLKIMKEVTDEKPVIWGKNIVGYGTYHYKYKSGREGDWMRTGFSPGKANFTVYIMPGYNIKEHKELLKKIGPHKLGVSCLYIKNLDDIHKPTLKKLIKNGLKEMKKRYPN